MTAQAQVPVARWSRREVREMLVGAATVLALALVLAYSYGGTRLQPALGGYAVKATFNRADGLPLGADVLLAGVKVGSVIAQSLDAHYRAVVTLAIDADIKLPADTAAAIHTDGLFGEKFMVLDPGGEEDTLAPGDEITFTQDAMIVEELLDLIIAEGRAIRAAAGAPASQGDE